MINATKAEKSVMTTYQLGLSLKDDMPRTGSTIEDANVRGSTRGDTSPVIQGYEAVPIRKAEDKWVFNGALKILAGYQRNAENKICAPLSGELGKTAGHFGQVKQDGDKAEILQQGS